MINATAIFISCVHWPIIKIDTRFNAIEHANLTLKLEENILLIRAESEIEIQKRKLLRAHHI